MARCAFVEDLAEEGIGFERIGLVDAGELAWPAPRLAAFGELKREVEQALRGLARDQERFARFVETD